MRDYIRERYYEHRAPVYDATSYRGHPEVDAGLDRETAELGALLGGLPLGRTLEVGCGTAVWTQFLCKPSLGGPVVALDQSESMLRLARARVPGASFVQARLPGLPFRPGAFDTLLAANFYGLLRPPERAAFLAEARRVARELLVVDLRSDGDGPTEGLERRTIDGVEYLIYRRRYTPEVLTAELGGDLFYPGRFFLGVRVALS